MEPTWGSLGSVARSEKRVEQSLLPACGSVARLSQLNTHVVQNSPTGQLLADLQPLGRLLGGVVALVAHRVLAPLDLDEPAWAAAAPAPAAARCTSGRGGRWRWARAGAPASGAARRAPNTPPGGAPNPTPRVHGAVQGDGGDDGRAGRAEPAAVSPLFMPTINSLISQRRPTPRSASTPAPPSRRHDAPLPPRSPPSC